MLNVHNIAVKESPIRLAGVNVLSLACKDEPSNKATIEERFQGKAIRRGLGPFFNISSMVSERTFFSLYMIRFMMLKMY
jgi:hypothetical protein